MMILLLKTYTSIPLHNIINLQSMSNSSTKPTNEKLKIDIEQIKKEKPFKLVYRSTTSYFGAKKCLSNKLAMKVSKKKIYY